MKAGGDYLLADMARSVCARTCADWTRAPGDRVRLRLFERAIDAGARDLPHTRNARQTITTSNGGRERLAHRLDLLWAKGRLPSIAAILAESSSLSMVISPTLDFSRAISSSRSSRSRSFKAVAAPASARSRHSVSLATETFVCRATKSLDGTVVRVRLDRKATSTSLLVVIGVREDGQKVLLAIKSMGGESTEAWRGGPGPLLAAG